MSSRTEISQIPDHTLLRVIGRGSYGEVWLARNVMGTHRAVKIVRRAAFDSDRPYLREFEGIRRCEPVSRAHDGLIDILHMGRNDEEGWFYYVMELADGALAETSGADGFQSYRPATLAERLTNGSLEALECLRVAESLTGALAFLHEQGLIHRDVKPSNVMYVGGVPKLGDIGLVAEAGSSRSFVGTEGFVPQEGPGTERADIFGLGKVLYETLTGLDRSKFPQLPEDWGQSYDFEQRVELNEIVLRACEGHSERRYLSAREMQADIALVASGRSVRKMRGMEHRLKLLRWLGFGAAAVAAVAVSISWLVQRQADRERTLRVRAVEAEKAERKARLLLLYDQVHAARHDPSAGAVTRALAAAKEAAAQGPTAQLRNDAIFLLSRPDFILRKELTPQWNASNVLPAIDAESGLCAEMPVPAPGPEAEPTTVTLHVPSAPEKKRTIAVEKPPPNAKRLEFSRGGKRLLIAGWYGGGTVLDTVSGAVIASWPPESEFTSLLTFCGEKGDAVVRRNEQGGLTVIQLASGETRTTPALTGWPPRDQRLRPENPQRVWPSPDGTRVLVIDDELRYPPPVNTLLSRLLPSQTSRPLAGSACLVEIKTGRQLWIRGDTTEEVAAWSQDGTRLALRRAQNIEAVDAARGDTVFTIPSRLYNRGTEPFFLHDRDHLAFSTWSDLGFCQLASGEMLCRPPVQGLNCFSQKSGLLRGGNGTAEWHPSKVHRTLTQRTLADHGGRFFSFPPDASCIIGGNMERFNVWPLDRDDCIPIADYPARGATGVLFSPAEKTARFLTTNGISEIPWTGLPPSSIPNPVPTGLPGVTRCDYYSISASGKVRALGGNQFAVVLQDGEPPRIFSVEDPANMVAVSPDGRWFALGTKFPKSVRIWDLDSKEKAPVHTEICGGPCLPLFSPKGKWLAISGFADNRILETGTWKPVASFPRHSATLIGPLSFTADERLMSITHQPSGCTIIETGQWRTRYEITSPLDEPFGRSGLSPDGRYFAAVGTRRELHVWDLQALDAELEKLGLGPE